jgi:hypothetical protein
MKISGFLFFQLLLLTTMVILLSGAQAESNLTSQGRDACQDSTREGDLNMENFTKEQHALWDSATLHWRQQDYHSCRKKAGFKVDCHDCSRLNVQARIQVDDKGNITGLEEIKASIDCFYRSEAEKTKVKNCLIESFKKVKFPEGFRNVTIIAWFDNGPFLSC